MRNKQKEILDFIKTIKTYKGKNKWIELSKLSKSEIENIKKEIGINLTGYSRIIDVLGIKHSLKRHGDKVLEEKRGQKAIEHADFLLIPFIVKYYDKISLGGRTKKTNLISIKYEKVIGYKYDYIEEVRTKRKKLAIKTLYKKPLKPKKE